MLKLNLFALLKVQICLKISNESFHARNVLIGTPALGDNLAVSITLTVERRVS